MAAIDDYSTPFTPAWWMKTLVNEQRRKLAGEADYRNTGRWDKPGMNLLSAWLDNNPPLPPGAPDWVPVYQAFHASTRSNYAERIVTSATERMTPIGFRTGADDDDNGDAKAEEIWAENQMPIQQVDLTYNMMGLAEGYTMVGPPRRGSEIPIITVEDPRSIQVAMDPLRYNWIRAAIKTYTDPYEGVDACVVYLPGETESEPCVAYTARKKSSRMSTGWERTGAFRPQSSAWEWDEGKELPTQRVPIGLFINRRHVSDFERHIPHLDRINRISLQRMVIADTQSFRQRAVEGLPDVWPADSGVAPELVGTKIDYTGIFTPGPGSMWKLPPGAKFWESQPIDLNPILSMENNEIKNLAALSGMLVAQFNPDDANGTAEGASLQRETLTFRIEDRKPIVDNGLAMTYSLAFEMIGDTQRAKMSAFETIWAEHQKNSLSEMYQAAAAAAQAGLSKRTIRREVLKYTPRQLRMAEADDRQQSILAPLDNTAVVRGNGLQVLPGEGAERSDATPRPQDRQEPPAA